MGRHPSHSWWRRREARSRRHLGGSIHDMCMRRQDKLCTRGDAERRLEGWQSGTGAERIQDQGQRAGRRRDCPRKRKPEEKGSEEGGLAGEEHDRTNRRSTIQDEERSRKNANFAIAIKPNRRIHKVVINISDSEDGGSTTSPLTRDLLTSPVPPALSRRRQKSPCSTSDAMSRESSDVMTVIDGSQLIRCTHV